jgi:transcriptional regulator with XRE-family HTH domain
MWLGFPISGDCMSIAKNIRTLRKAQKLSYRGLANKIPVDSSAIWQIENEGREPGVYLAEKIAKALGTTVDKLLSK